MDDRFHLISDCLSEDWIEAWASEGVRVLEELLAKHAAFETFLETDD